MAAGRSLGVLTLDLIAKIGGFTAGLDSAEREAKKRAKAIEKVFDAAGTAAGVAFSTAIAGALAGAAIFDRLIKQVGDFQDIAEKTGGSAEGFASFAVAAATAGVEINTVAAASIRLTKGLTGVDDESKAAGAAIEALGLSISEFKELAPEDQLETVAKALAGFEDGAQKTAVAMALFGKAGAELLPFLKELEAQGGRQVVLTAEQIKAADDYADSQARAVAQLQQYAQSIAVQALPAVTAFIEALTDSAKAIVSVDDATENLRKNKAILGFAEEAATVLANIIDYARNAADVFVYLGRTIGATGAVVAAAARGDFASIGAIVDAARADGESLFKADLAGKIANQFTNARAQLQKAASDRQFSKSIEAEARRLEQISGGGLDTGTRKLQFDGAEKKEKSKKAQQTEADRYLESLQKQLEKTQDLTVAEQVLIDIQSGRLGKVSAAQKESILLTARQIDAAKEVEKAIELRRAATVAEGDAVLKVNQAYQDRLKTLMDATPSAMLEKQRADVKLLTEEYEAGRLSEEAYLEAVTARLDLVADKTKDATDFAKDLGLTFTSAFEDAIASGKGLGDILKSLAQDILKLGVRKFITEPGGKFLEGIFSGLAGGATAGPNAALAGGLDDFFRAAGGPVTAGSPYIVGERGPELIVPSMSGTVIPNHAMGVQKGGSNYTYAPTINIDSRADIAQVRAIVDRQLRGGFAEFTDRMETSG